MKGNPAYKSTIIFFLFLIFHSSWASVESLKSVGVEASDIKGCYLSDGKQVLGGTLGLMVDAYDHHPKLSNKAILEVINTAIGAGCNINEVNASGLSPLNSAILLNHPALVSLFLESGADPKLKISSPKAYLNNKNSFELYVFLSERKDMFDIGEILTSYK